MLAGLLGLGSRASQIAWRFSREVVLLMVAGALVVKSAIIHTYILTPCTSQHTLQIESTTASILINATILKPT
jgi:hypothetical protein